MPSAAARSCAPNKSYVFFRELKGAEGESPLGTQDISLSDGRGLAVDTQRFTPSARPCMSRRLRSSPAYAGRRVPRADDRPGWWAPPSAVPSAATSTSASGDEAGHLAGITEAPRQLPFCTAAPAPTHHEEKAPEAAQPPPLRRGQPSLGTHGLNLKPLRKKRGARSRGRASRLKTFRRENHWPSRKQSTPPPRARRHRLHHRHRQAPRAAARPQSVRPQGGPPADQGRDGDRGPHRPARHAPGRGSSRTAPLPDELPRPRLALGTGYYGQRWSEAPKRR